MPGTTRQRDQIATHVASGEPDQHHLPTGSYSGHRALNAQQRAGLFTCLTDLIDTVYGGTITKAYLHELRLARRRVDR
jgi:hypothetical protein